MTITFRGATGCVGSSDTASPYSSRNYGSSITGQSAGDLLFALWGGKPYSTSPSSPTNATYTTLARRESGTTAEGDSTGSVAAQIFYKTSAGASEPNSPISDYSAPYNPAVRAVAGFYKSVAGSWTVESCVGSTESDPISVTGSSQLNFATGDVIAVLVTLNNNSDLSSPSLSVSGCTLANLTQRLPSTTAASGDDGGMCLYTADVTAGSATAAPSFSATSSPSNTAASIIFVRIAEPTVKTNGAAAFSSQSSLTANGTNKVNAAISLSGQSSFAAAGRRRLSGQVGSYRSHRLLPLARGGRLDRYI